MILNLGEETITAEEPVQIARLVAQNLELLDERSQPVRRGQHPKHHGCVRATLAIEDGLPSELSHGLFSTPRDFSALVRFSNGAALDDRKGDAHGMAIKLFDVSGEKLLEPCDTHDFVLLDHPVFFIRNVTEYVALFDAVLAAQKSRMQGLFFFLPRAWMERALVFMRFLSTRPHELAILKKLTSKRPECPLDCSYWSTTPYKLGSNAVRWMVKPGPIGLAPDAREDSPDKLRHALVARLAREDASFEFMAQLQTNAESMPIEDPTIAWDERASPWRKVATLRVPAQKFDSPALMEFCENLSFNPWRCIGAHRPLGGINRARRAIYDAVSRRRHELNRVHVREPTLADYLARVAQ